MSKSYTRLPYKLRNVDLYYVNYSFYFVNNGKDIYFGFDYTKVQKS